MAILRAMRVLLVSHLFPPAHGAGTEVYTLELARRLRARDHDVLVFTTDKDIGRANFSVRERSHAGVAVTELTNNLFYEDFEETWSCPPAEEAFAVTLDSFRPDVVHFQHLMYLSVGCLELAAARGAAVVFTLHDFWLECPRMGQLVHADGSICHTVDHDRCGTCLARFKWRQSAIERGTGRLIAGVRSLTGVDLGPIARGARRLLRPDQRAPGAEGAGPGDGAGDARASADFASAARARDGALRARVLASVDCFVSPSAFLLERFVAWGIPRARIRHLATGVDRAAFEGVRREAPAGSRADRPLRIVFLGTLVPLKGAHVLLDAWSRLSETERERGELAVFGPAEHAPAYVADLEARARALGVRLGGALGRDEVSRTLAASDLLVVPSTWFENRPLIVLEALAARTPLLVSDLGGLAELVVAGESGWTFPVGDATALAGHLRRVLADPTPLTRLYAAPQPLASWEELTEGTEALYREVREAFDAGRGRRGG